MKTAMPPPYAARPLAALAVILLLSGCFGDMNLGELMELSTVLKRELKDPAVGVNLTTGRHLTLNFQNSPNADLPTAERDDFARRAAELVRDHYAGYAGLESISIAFAREERTGPVRRTWKEVPYRFTPAELGMPPDVQ